MPALSKTGRYNIVVVDGHKLRKGGRSDIVVGVVRVGDLLVRVLFVWCLVTALD